jgi:DNA-binding NarL/FixJ family response regulator
MPEMNDIEVARELTKQHSKAKIVFLTVHEDSDILATCLAAGGLGYVVKLLMDSDESAAKSGQSNLSKFNDTSSAAPAPTVPTIRDHAVILSPKASREGEWRSRDRHIGEPQNCPGT